MLNQKKSFQVVLEKHQEKNEPAGEPPSHGAPTQLFDQHAVGKVVDWDKDFLLRCTFWAGVVVVSGRCIVFNCDRALNSDLVEQIKLIPPEHGKVLSIPVWFDSENTGEGV